MIDAAKLPKGRGAAQLSVMAAPRSQPNAADILVIEPFIDLRAETSHLSNQPVGFELSSRRDSH